MRSYIDLDRLSDSCGGFPAPAPRPLTAEERASIKKRFRVKAHTLEAVSSLEYDEGDRPECSIGGRTLYGGGRRPESYIDDVTGFIDIETPRPSFGITSSLILEIATEIANEESPVCIEISEWNIKQRSETVIRFKPKSWEEIELGFRLNGGEKGEDD